MITSGTFYTIRIYYNDGTYRDNTESLVSSYKNISNKTEVLNVIDVSIDISRALSHQDKRYLLRLNGWSTWYNEDYWVNKKMAPKDRDYTYYGRNTNDAIKWELEHICD